jgi:PAS domain S-box-containing protein
VSSGPTSRARPDELRHYAEREHSQRLLASQKRVLELLAGSASLEEVLEAIVRIIEEQSSGAAGAICLVDPETNQVRLGAAPNVPDDFWRIAQTISIAPDVGTFAAAAALGEPVSTPDIKSDYRWRDLRALAFSIGIRAAWATPIRGHDGRVLGAIGMYFREARAPTAHERVVAEVLERTAALAIERRVADRLLHESEERFRTLVDQTTAGVVQADRDGRMTLVNQRWCEMLGYSEAEMLRMSVLDVTDPRDLAATLEDVARMAAGGPNFEIEKRYRRKDGSVLWATSSVNARRGPAGEFQGLVAVVVDITDRKRAQGALQVSEERLRAAVEAGAIGILDVDYEKGFARFSPELCAILGVPPGTETAAEKAYFFVDPRDLPDIEARLQQAKSSDGDVSWRAEFRALRRDGASIWITVRARLHFRETPAGRELARCVGTVIDITERKQAEERVMLLMREVNHRAKNLLAVVQAVARLTAGEEDPKLFAEHFGHRIAGLAASHDLLVQSQWQGVEAGALVRSQLAHFKDLIGKRIRLSGPPVSFNPAAAQGVGMALHELATNAGKYGALSDGQGHVEVAWDVVEDEARSRFELKWAERDGPHPQPPQRKGFGHTVLVDMVEHELGARVRLDYTEAGLTWELSAPADAILES